MLANYLNSEETINVILKALPIVFAYFILQASVIMLMSMIKGLGLQNKAVLWTFISCYVIGLPLSYFMAYKAQSFFGWSNRPWLKHVQGFNGFFIGNIIGLIILHIQYLQTIYCRNWRTHAKKMLQDMNQDRQAGRQQTFAITSRNMSIEQEYQAVFTERGLENYNFDQSENNFFEPMPILEESSDIF